MRWRKAAAVGGAALGAAAVYNVAAARGGAPLDVLLGGEPGEILWRGHRIAFSRHGRGTPVLLVHGIHAGASSFEWRHTVPALAERYRVIALDLLGFGRSDRPSVRYTPGLYQALLADVVTRVAGAPCTVVASGLSAAHLVALAARDSRHIASLAAIGPTGVARLREPEGAPGALTRSLLDAPVVGDALYRGLTSPVDLRRYLESVYFDDRLVTRELVDQYVRAARQPGGKHAVSALLSGKLEVDVRAALRRVRQPTLLLWGALARRNPVEHAHVFRVLGHDVEWVLVPEAGDLPHDERPDDVNAALASFLERSRGSSGAGGPRLAMA